MRPEEEGSDAGHAYPDDPEWLSGPWATPSDEQIDASKTMESRWGVLNAIASTGVDLSSTIEPSATRRTEETREDLGRLGVSASPAPLEVDAEVLGRGGMSVVRLGRQPSLGRTVAVKELPESSSRDERASLELLREAWITGRLEHPNVMPVYDVDVDADGRPRLVLKRIEGVPWAHLIARPAEVRMRFGVAEPIRWHVQVFLQVCNAVHFAHSHQVLHRDLKPDNVMIGAFGEVYLLDWGIAVKGQDGEYPTSSEVVGTPAYIAPEMVTGESIGPWTDVYLLGGLLHEIYTGGAPHTGETMQELVWSALTGVPSLGDDVPEDVAAVIRRCLARDIKDRYASADAVRRALLEAIEREESQALARAGMEFLDRLERLDSAVLGGDAGEAEADAAADEVHDRFGACRFAFQSALERWPANPTALDGLRRAELAMVEYALARGDVEQAEARMLKLNDPPEGLRLRVEAAKESAAAEAARIAGLERIVKDLDKGVGMTSRFWLILIMGVLWVVIPLVQNWTSGPRGLSATMGTLLPAVYFLIVGVLLYSRRRTMWSNRYNRRLWSCLLVGLAGEFIFDAGQLMRGVEALPMLINDMGFRSVNVAMAALFVERTLVIAAFTYTLAYVIATVVPDSALLGVAISDAALVGCLAYRWRPKAAAGEPLLSEAN